MEKINIENLVVLVYASNNCYTEVITIEKALKEYKTFGFKVDLENCSWTFRSRNSLDKMKLNQSRFIGTSQRFGVIGVYDITNTNIANLNLMVDASQEAVNRRDHSSDD